jgi:rod shape-determining protein MreC
VTKIQQNPESPFAKIISTPVAGVSNHLQLLLLELPEPKESDPPKAVPEASTEPKKDNVKTNAKTKVKPNASH